MTGVKQKNEKTDCTDESDKGCLFIFMCCSVLCYLCCTVLCNLFTLSVMYVILIRNREHRPEIKNIIQKSMQYQLESNGRRGISLILCCF